MTVEPCSKQEREYFVQLWNAFKQAERDVAVAFTAFCYGHGVPLGAELEGVSEHGLLVKRPSE